MVDPEPTRGDTMTDHPTLHCQACSVAFEAELPLTRRAFARSRIMFLVERCPTCGDTRAYLRSAYSFVAQRALVSA